MAGRGNPQSGNSSWYNGDWDKTIEIGVWDPATVTNAGNWNSTNSSTTSSSSSNYPSGTPSSNEYQVQNFPIAQNDPSANWSNQAVSADSYQFPQQQMPVYRHPNSQFRQASSLDPYGYNSQYVNPTGPNYGNSEASALMHTNYQSPAQYLPQQQYNSVQEPANLIRTAENLNFTPSSTSYSSLNSSSSGTCNARTFKNPLLDVNSDCPEKLIEQLHIQQEKAKKNTATNAPRGPTMLSKSAMAMLQSDLNEAAFAFQSAENLKLARDAHLGFDITNDISDKVVISNLSANAAAFIPRVIPVVLEIPPNDATKDEEEQIIESLNNLIENVLQQPGIFNEAITVWLGELKPFHFSDEAVKRMVEIIFRKAIDEDNFKYLGAKLSDILTQPKVLPSFRSIFLTHLQREYRQILELLEKHDESNEKKINGFCMFMAEVFIHIKIKGIPVKALGRSLSKLLEMISKGGSVANISFVSKVLKLAGGPLLDAFEQSDDDMQNYNKNFQILTEFAEKLEGKSDGESRKILLLIKSVINIRKSNWGRTSSSTRPIEPINDPSEFGENLSLVDPNYYMNEPVFFTPEGVQYTAAEAQIPDFYQQYLSKYDINQPWSLNDEEELVPSDEEFGELFDQTDDNESEYNEEYEKFLLESGQLK